MLCSSGKHVCSTPLLLFQKRNNIGGSGQPVDNNPLMRFLSPGFQAGVRRGVSLENRDTAESAHGKCERTGFGKIFQPTGEIYSCVGRIGP